MELVVFRSRLFYQCLHAPHSFLPAWIWQLSPWWSNKCGKTWRSFGTGISNYH